MAQQRKNKTSANTGPLKTEKTSVSILDSLKSKKSQPAAKPKLLNKIIRKTDKSVTAETVTPDKAISDTTKTSMPTPTPTPVIASAATTEVPAIATSKTPKSIFTKIFLDCRNNSTSINQNNDLNLNLNSIYLPYANKTLVEKISSNFSQPSPDDVVLKANANSVKLANEPKAVADELKNLKIDQFKPTKPTLKLDLNTEIEKRQKKPHISFVVIGHVDAGKSTLTGRLLLETSTVDKSYYNKLKREAEKSGKGSFSLAWIMDQTAEERERGVTVDSCTTDFETDNTYFTIIDSPGHKDFVPNMISGAIQADVALLVVDASTNAFESGFNLDGQTKEHTILVKSLGINKILVAVNKMDNVDWSKDRFEEIKNQLEEFLKITGFEEISFVPCSGLSGLNVLNKPANLSSFNWFKGETLLKTLENFSMSEKEFKRPFLLTISNVLNDSEFVGRINVGTIQPGESVKFLPTHQIGRIDSILINSKTKSNIGIAGDNVLLKIKDIKNVVVDNDKNKIGDLITIINNDEIKIIKKFVCKVVLFDIKSPLIKGIPFMLFNGNSSQPAKIDKILKLVNKSTGEEIVGKKLPKHLISNQCAIVEISLVERGLPLQTFKENKALGRIIIRKDGFTVGVGIIEELLFN